MSKDATERPRRKRRGAKVESLAKGDTLFADGPVRVTIKKTGANGGRVRAVITADEGTEFKVVKRSKANG